MSKNKISPLLKTPEKVFQSYQHNKNFNQNNQNNQYCYLENGFEQSCFEKGITLSRNHLLLKEIYLWYTFHWHPRLLNASARDRDVEQKKKWKEREGGGERERMK